MQPHPSIFYALFENLKVLRPAQAIPPSAAILTLFYAVGINSILKYPDTESEALWGLSPGQAIPQYGLF